MRSRAMILAAGALATAGAVAGFAGGQTALASATAASAGSVPSIVKLVPKAIRSGGRLTVASDATYAPDEFIGSNGTTVVGMDADLMNAIGKVMGLKVSIANVTFDNIIPGMVAGRYMIGASSFTDTKAREKQVNFVDYAYVGESFYTLAHGGTNIKSIANICGLTVSVEKGTTEETDAQAQSKTCTKEGKKAVNVRVFPDQTEANLAVSSGRAQLGFADTPVADYQVKEAHGKFRLVGAAYAPAPYGLAVAKSTGSLTDAVKAAVLYLVKNGTYNKIFKKWGVQSIEIKASGVKIDGAAS
ncbi:MAG: ABC transporter substrate-binding protein [Solirubrobacteraceae bacterium]